MVSAITCRQLSNPVGVPRQNGEFVEIASSTGAHLAIRAITSTPASADGTATCTCVPQRVRPPPWRAAEAYDHR